MARESQNSFKDLRSNLIMLKINEIFYSIQGESRFQGRPCTFVRLSGCPLRCSYCDTTYAYFEGHECTVESVVEKVKQIDCPLVEVTGGEPLIQPPVIELMQRLLDLKFEVLLETSGSLSIKSVPRDVRKIVDMKCPSSLMDDKNDYSIFGDMQPWDELKFVIGDYQDFEWAMKLIKRFNLPPEQLLFSTVFGKLSLDQLAEWFLNQPLLKKSRMQIQMHKIIWGDKRGV